MMKNEPEMQHYFGRIADTAELEKVHPRLKAAFDFLRRKGLATLACGTYELEGGAPGEKAAVFAMAELDPSRPDFAFDEEKDVGFVDMDCELKTLRPGEFAVFMPPRSRRAPASSG